MTLAPGLPIIHSTLGFDQDNRAFCMDKPKAGLTLATALAMAMGLLSALPPAARAQGPKQGVDMPAGCPPLLDHRVPRLQDEAPQDLCRHAGQVVLVVNTASHCGFTRQYEGLEKLHARYAARGLVVLGFPSNDFGNQEPGTNAQIAEFCSSTFGVKFPMFTKTVVTGQKAHPLFAQLTRESGKAPGWNFHKYLIGRDGQVVAQYSAFTSPEDPKLVSRVERLLAETPPRATAARSGS